MTFKDMGIYVYLKRDNTIVNKDLEMRDLVRTEYFERMDFNLFNVISFTEHSDCVFFDAQHCLLNTYDVIILAAREDKKKASWNWGDIGLQSEI